MRYTLHLYNAQQAAVQMRALWPELKSWLMAGNRLEMEIRPERRSTESNAKMWALLGELSAQVDWYGQKLTPEEWKCVLSSALKKQKVVPGIDGGFVVVGAYTSRMSKAEMSELIELIQAFGAEHGVEFREPEMEVACAS